jgi:hypothetical protein
LLLKNHQKIYQLLHSAWQTWRQEGASTLLNQVKTLENKFKAGDINATFNNISAISWRSVLLVEETGGPGENHDLSQVTDKLYHIMLYTSQYVWLCILRKNVKCFKTEKR